MKNSKTIRMSLTRSNRAIVGHGRFTCKKFKLVRTTISAEARTGDFWQGGVVLAISSRVREEGLVCSPTALRTAVVATPSEWGYQK